MLEKDTLIKVINRDSGTVGYTIPDLGNLHRNFQPGEEKSIPFEEIRKLSYLPGGYEILRDCLLITNEEALEELFSNIEPEYFYTSKEVEKLLLEGSTDQLRDCLDFAPLGVIALVKEKAVNLEINDIVKRNIIFEKTGFNVNKAIEINHLSEAQNESNTPSRRRAEPISKQPSEPPVRRTAYKVVGAE